MYPDKNRLCSRENIMDIPYVPTASGVHCQTEGGGGGEGRLIIHEMEIEIH